jgi:hypothetical protein
MKKYELVEIAKAGGNIIVDASKYKKYELVEVAKALKEGSTLLINNASSMKKYELVEIAKANPGAVTFDI